MSLADVSRRSRQLKQWALEEGFHRAGVAKLTASSHPQAVRRWLAAGHHAGMGYMERHLDKRLDASKLLEGARTALVVALHYAPLNSNGASGSVTPGADAHISGTLDEHSAGEAAPRSQPTAALSSGESDLWSRVARYARGDDYHDVMKKRLRNLEERIESAFPGSKSRSYVDTGPILERELAARAGLGAVGKNTNLLHRQGSWFLLGEVLLTLELEPDQPLADMCGECTRCLDACPTKAFPEPYVLDANRCISYWTIEHRGEIPIDRPELVGEWLFGCDVCQEVCPWNAFHERRGERTFDEAWARVPERRGELSLEQLMSMSRESYVEAFRRSPMKRAKLEGLKRNAAILSKNLAEPHETAKEESGIEDCPDENPS